MPFLFERIDDDSELLLPDNLLRSDSVIAKLVSEYCPRKTGRSRNHRLAVPVLHQREEGPGHWQGRQSEDIPAATQLFTPNWIVQYLVQNSVGRLWLMANPQSTLAKSGRTTSPPPSKRPRCKPSSMPSSRPVCVKMADTLNPETITVLDPACGSGHILVVAYDVLKAIYLERGYQPRAIPRLILEKNLYGWTLTTAPPKWPVLPC